MHETHRFLEASLIARFVVLALAQPKRPLLYTCSRTASTNSDCEISGIMALSLSSSYCRLAPPSVGYLSQ